MISVNLTTTSSRLFLCSATVWSLAHQELQPDHIFLWISQEPYLSDKGINDEIKFVAEINNVFKRDLVKIKYVKNTGPYRKILPAIKDAELDDVLVYADDDVVYDYKWLSSLISSFEENERKYVVASRVRKITYNIWKRMKSYETFPIVTSKMVLPHDFIITGVGGAVLTKAHIHTKFLEDNSYLEIAPKTDDIWISKIIELSQSKVITCPESLSYVQEILHSNFTLSSENTLISKNFFFLRFVHKFRVKLLAYCGCLNTNNDLSIKKVEQHFKKVI